MGLACFTAASYADAIELLDFFNEIILTNGKSVNANNEGSVIESALKAYGLLFSGLWGNSKRGSDKAREEFERIMQVLLNSLNLVLWSSCR